MKKIKLILGVVSMVLGALSLSQNSIKAEASGYEQENNNSYATATDMYVNDSVQGNISDYDDTDYYKVQPDSDGKLEISFNHVYQDSYDDWNVYTYMYEDGKYIQLSENNIKLKSDEKVKLPSIGVKASGVYYIVVERCCDVVGIDYTIKTSFTKTSYYEKEVNDTYAEATPMEIGKSYSGNISCGDDKDFYKITAPYSGYYKISFNHVYQNSYEDWNVYVYSYENGKYTELSNTNVDLNSDACVWLPSVGMNKGKIYFIKVERCCDVIGVDYSVKVSMSANGPSTISAKSAKNSIKISWKKATSVNGYEVYYKVGKTGKYKKYKSTKKTAINFTNAKKGKKYYFKVRGYVIVDGKTYYSSFSKAQGSMCK